MDVRLIFIIIAGLIWLFVRLARRPQSQQQEQPEQEQPEQDITFTESEVDFPPWTQMQAEEFPVVEEEEIIESVEEEIPPRVAEPAPAAIPQQQKEAQERSETTPEESTTTPDISTKDRTVAEIEKKKRPRQPKEIAGIPVNAQSVRFGIVLSEILNRPAFRRVESRRRRT